MQKQSVYSREFYAITEAMSGFRHYLLGHQFVIKTDQKSLKELLEQTLQTLEQQQWLPKFFGYDFKIQYSPRKENILAYALSWRLAMAWSAPSHTWFQSVATATKTDATLSKIYQDCIENAGKSGEYVV